jgi:hypothetical protein
MRPAPLLIAAASLALVAAPAFAASSSPSKSSPPDTSSPPAASSDKSAPADTSAPPAASTGTSANTSATAGGFTVGMPVKDNTGATIGSISDIKADASGKQSAVIKMGSDTFAVSTGNLGQANGAATINLTQAQINNMLHKGGAAGSSSGGSSAGGASGGSTTQH